MEKKVQWKVVCSGNIRAGFDQQQVLENLTHLNIHLEQAKKLVSGTSITVKQNLEQAVAFRLKSRLEKTGLEVELKRMPRKLVPSIQKLSVEPIEVRKEEKATESSNIGSAFRPGEMACPKCNKVQIEADECIQCGIIISRYLQRHDQTRADSASVDEADDEADDEQVDRPAGFWEGNFGRAVAAVIAAGVLYLLNSMFSSGAGYQPVGTSPAAKAQTEMALAAAKLESPAPAKTRRLLEVGRYAEVESMLRELDEKARWDPLWESPYQTMVDSFSPENGFRIETLDSWVEERHSAWAYLARASYYVSEAGTARGDKLAKYTSDSQFASYRSLQRKAYVNLVAAKEKNRNLIPVYTLILMVADTQGSDVSIKEVLDEAISVNPAGFYYRYQYLRNLMPKWGGSYKQMAHFVDATSQYVSLNPRLTVLPGYAIGEEAFAAMKRENYDTCISLYSEALQFGANAGWLRYRANCLTKIGEYDKALEDVTLSLQIHEDDFAKELRNWLRGRT